MRLEIADRLARLRREHGLSQERLAEQLGVSRQAVSKWERAEASPDTDNLILLARLYGVSLDELLRTDAPTGSAAEGSEWKPTEDEVVRLVREAWRQQSVPSGAEPSGMAEPPREEPRDSFTDEAPVWETAPADTASGLPAEEPNGPDALLDRRKARKNRIRMWRGIYPTLCAFFYLFLGFCLHAWNPGWLIFLTIPLFNRLMAHWE